ncbi:MAG: hypothetical protein HYT87_19870 [Nitrospirae bacterium]|nr:hypothetical protein [Nitrospirota bacterium]
MEQADGNGGHGADDAPMTPSADGILDRLKLDGALLKENPKNGRREFIHEPTETYLGYLGRGRTGRR